MAKPTEIRPLKDNGDIQIEPIARPITGGEQRIPKKFNPDWEYGRGVVMKSRTDKVAIDYLHKQAKSVLPKGTPYQLRMMDRRENDGWPEWVDKTGITGCWYYSPYLEKSSEKFSTKRWKLLPDLVYIRGMYYA